MPTTELGTTTKDRFTHSSNASLPTLRTEFEIATLIKSEHLLKAASPMQATEKGIV